MEISICHTKSHMINFERKFDVSKWNFLWLPAFLSLFFADQFYFFCSKISNDQLNPFQAMLQKSLEQGFQYFYPLK